MSDTPTPASALTDEQIDVNLKIIRDCAASLTRAVSAPGLVDRTVAAVIARAKREAAEEIAEDIEARIGQLTVGADQSEMFVTGVAIGALRDAASIARQIGATR